MSIKEIEIQLPIRFGLGLLVTKSAYPFEIRYGSDQFIGSLKVACRIERVRTSTDMAIEFMNRSVDRGRYIGPDLENQMHRSNGNRKFHIVLNPTSFTRMLGIGPTHPHLVHVSSGFNRVG